MCKRVIGGVGWWSLARAQAKGVVVLQVSQQALAKPVPGHHLWLYVQIRGVFKVDVPCPRDGTMTGGHAFASWGRRR